MKLTVVGCGDAFGSGGRLQTCYHVDHEGHQFLIDCGATALIGLNRQGLDPNAVAAVFISHLHGDHFSGLVWWMLHATHVGKRKTPLHVVGPAGVEARFMAAAEILFPGSSSIPRKFELTFRELVTEAPLTQGPVTVTPFEVSHPSGSTSYALRFSLGKKTLSFTGDTEWVETLVPAGEGADLYIMECYAPDGPTRYHMNWKTITDNLPRIGARRILLTHMSGPMLAQVETLAARPDVIIAEDGLVLRI